jgi:hypothetical protein
MTNDIFVCSLRNFATILIIRTLIKRGDDSQGLAAATGDSRGVPRRQSDKGPREANREIQTGNYRGDFERDNNIAYLPFEVSVSNGLGTFCFSPPLLRRLDIVYLHLP